MLCNSCLAKELVAKAAKGEIDLDKTVDLRKPVLTEHGLASGEAGSMVLRTFVQHNIYEPCSHLICERALSLNAQLEKLGIYPPMTEEDLPDF